MRIAPRARRRPAPVATPALALVALLALTPGARAGEPLVHEATVDADVDEVWQLFTTEQGIESWMVAQCEVDLRVGGTLRTHYDPDGEIGDAKTITHEFLAYDPKRMLAMRVVGCPADFPFAEEIEQTWSVVYFEPIGAKRTRVRIVGLGYGDSETFQEMRKYFDQGNAWEMKKLQERVASGEPVDWRAVVPGKS